MPQSQTTTSAGLLKLTVTTGGNQEIRLPEDSVTIHADITPQQGTVVDFDVLL